MRLLVKTYNLSTGAHVCERLLDYTQSDARFWLTKQIVWACNNGHGVQVCNIDDETKLAA